MLPARDDDIWMLWAAHSSATRSLYPLTPNRLLYCAALAPVGPAPSLRATEVRLTESQQNRLNELAVKTGRAPDELVQEAVDRRIDYDRWFAEQVRVGLDQIARGEFIEGDEMDARVERMLQS